MSRMTSPERPSDWIAWPLTVARTPPALPRLIRNPPRVSKRLVSPFLINPRKSVPSGPSIFVQESWSNSSTRETTAGPAASPAPGGGAGRQDLGLPHRGCGLARHRDVLQVHRLRSSGRRGLLHSDGGVSLRPCDQSENEQQRGHPSDEQPGRRTAPAPEPAAARNDQ